jgi:glutamate formiminotransferase
VGARKFLISYYVSFDSTDVAMVRSIARELRPASSGLKGVKAIPLLAHGQVQLSVSITDYKQTPVSQVYRKICTLAGRFKSAPVHGEVVGLIPEAACERDSDWMRLLVEFDPDTKVLERRLTTPLTWPGGN